MTEEIFEILPNNQHPSFNPLFSTRCFQRRSPQPPTKTRAGGFCLCSNGFQPVVFNPLFSTRCFQPVVFNPLFSTHCFQRRSPLPPTKTRAGGFYLRSNGFQPVAIFWTQLQKIVNFYYQTLDITYIIYIMRIDEKFTP